MSEWDVKIGDIVIFEKSYYDIKDIVTNVEDDEISVKILDDKHEKTFLFSKQTFFRHYSLDEGYMKQKQWNKEIKEITNEY